MEPSGSKVNDSSKEETPLICGLSDDIAVLCLARVPRIHHAKLKCVSKRWRKLVCGKEWHIIRKKYNLEETWIYAFCRDGYGKGGLPKHSFYVLNPYASRRCWKRIQDLPPCIEQRWFMNFEVLGHKAYLMGGRDGHFGKPKIADEVYCYDAITNSWSKVASLTTARCHYASEVLDGKIYAIGSHYSPDGKHTWEAYNSITNIWTAEPDLREIGYCCASLVFNGKLYVRKGLGASDDCDRGAVYNPETSTWQDADNDFLMGCDGTTVVVASRLYSFVSRLDKCILMTWQEDTRKWVMVGELLQFLDEPPLCIVAIGESMFLIDDGLATAELDVSSVSNGGELLLSDVTGPIPEVVPLICKCMTI